MAGLALAAALALPAMASPHAAIHGRAAGDTTGIHGHAAEWTWVGNALRGRIWIHIRGTMRAQYTANDAYTYDVGHPFTWTLTCSDGFNSGPFSYGTFNPITVSPCDSCTFVYDGWRAEMCPTAADGCTFEAFGAYIANLGTLGSGSFSFVTPCASPPATPPAPPPVPPPSPPKLPGQVCATKYIYPGNSMVNDVSEVIRLPPLTAIRAISIWLWIDETQDTGQYDYILDARSPMGGGPPSRVDGPSAAPENRDWRDGPFNYRRFNTHTPCAPASRPKHGLPAGPPNSLGCVSAYRLGICACGIADTLDRCRGWERVITHKFDTPNPSPTTLTSFSGRQIVPNSWRHMYLQFSYQFDHAMGMFILGRYSALDRYLAQDLHAKVISVNVWEHPLTTEEVKGLARGERTLETDTRLKASFAAETAVFDPVDHLRRDP